MFSVCRCVMMKINGVLRSHAVLLASAASGNEQVWNSGVARQSLLQPAGSPQSKNYILFHGDKTGPWKKRRHPQLTLVVKLTFNAGWTAWIRSSLPPPLCCRAADPVKSRSSKAGLRFRCRSPREDDGWCQTDVVCGILVVDSVLFPPPHGRVTHMCPLLLLLRLRRAWLAGHKFCTAPAWGHLLRADSHSHFWICNQKITFPK